MGKYLFFTGAKCSGCGVLYEKIAESGLSERFNVMDVGERMELAQHYRVRSLPHIVSLQTGQHFVGVAEGIQLINGLSRQEVNY